MELQVDIVQELKQAEKVLYAFMQDEQHLLNVERAALVMAGAIRNGGKIISCGNGGSHCDAMHFAEELTGRYRSNRKPLPAIAISDPSHLSCVGNDFGYEDVFSRYIEALGKPGDVLLGITSSGNSPNIIKAVNTATAVLLLGNDGGKLKSAGDVSIIVPHTGFADRIQEIHIKVIHIIIYCLEKLV
jgi:D-sedoheptulose 7-phosphate isomerase